MTRVKTNYLDPLAYYEIAYFIKNYLNENTVIVCIGTDRCIGDALGPFVGTMLKDSSFPYPVYGTIEEPIHASNLERRIHEIMLKHPRANIIGIDACLGDTECIGEVRGNDYPVHPGKGIGKDLLDVGETSIIGIVDSSENSLLFVHSDIRLDFIMKMSKVITQALIHAAYLSVNTSSDETALEV